MAANDIHFWNSLLCPPLGFVFNLLLLWLILRRTPKEMAVHSRVLLQTCLLDLLLLLLQTAGQHSIIFDQDDMVFVVFFDGYLARLCRTAFPPFVLISLQTFHYTFYYLSEFGITLQFIYRYLVLNRGIKVTLRHYLLLFCCPSLGYILAMSLPISIAGYGSMNVNHINSDHFIGLMDFTERTLYFTMTIDSFVDQTTSYMLYALHAVSYVLIPLTAWRMFSFVRNNAAYNGRLKALNRQLTFNLIVLALFPLLLDLLDLLSIFGGDDRQLALQFYISLAFHWLPVLNPLASIFTNRPYRDSLLLLGRLFKVAPASVISPYS